MFMFPHHSSDEDSIAGSPPPPVSTKKRGNISITSTYSETGRPSAKKVLDFSSSSQPSQPTVINDKAKVLVRPMEKSELQTVIKWAKKLGWNPGKYEFNLIYEAYPNSFWVLEKDGTMIGSLACVPYTNEFAFFGLYIIDEEYRGLGYGKILCDQVLERYKHIKTIGLNSVIDQIPSYTKRGFQNSHLNTRWTGKPSRSSYSANITNISLVEASQVLINDLIAYDKSIFHTARPQFLSLWLKMPATFTFVALKDNIIQGYGAICSTHKGYSIAPLFATDQTVAEKLFAKLHDIVQQNNGAEKVEIQLDTITDNASATALAKKFGLEPTFNTLRMYMGFQPPFDNSKVFGLTSLEFG